MFNRKKMSIQVERGGIEPWKDKAPPRRDSWRPILLFLALLGIGCWLSSMAVAYFSSRQDRGDIATPTRVEMALEVTDDVIQEPETTVEPEVTPEPTPDGPVFIVPTDMDVTIVERVITTTPLPTYTMYPTYTDVPAREPVVIERPGEDVVITSPPEVIERPIYITSPPEIVIVEQTVVVTAPPVYIPITWTPTGFLASPTPILTATPSVTMTPTAPITMTAIPTIPTVTMTPTVSPTVTTTWTPTASPTMVSTATVTPSPTVTVTSTATPIEE